MVEWKQSEASLAWEIYTASAHAVLNLTDLQQEACASSTSRDDDTSYRQPQYYFDELSTLCEAGHMDLAHLYLLSECKRLMEEQYLKECWDASGLAGASSCADVHFGQVEGQLVASLEAAAAAMHRLCPPLEAFCSIARQATSPGKKPQALETTVREFQSHASVVLLTQAPLPLPELLQQYYCWKLLEFFKAAAEVAGTGSISSVLAYMETGAEGGGEAQEEEEEEEEQFELDPIRSDRRMDSAVLNLDPSFAYLPRLTAALAALNLQDVNQLAYEAAMCQATQRYVTKRTRGELSVSVLLPADTFLEVVILNFLSVVLGKDLVGKAAVVDGYRKQFGCYIRSIVGQLRIVDIFDIVTDFPESADAVADLQECMRHCSLQKRLVRSYCQACASRLHIPGAKTTDIIEFYVHSIKILRQLDPTGILLEAVSAPTREYLQTRRDAIRCIVSAMTDDSPVVAGESLFDELRRPAEEEEDDEEQEDDAFALHQAQTWSPEPVNADIRNTPKAQRMHDIISMLVHIYGSKDLFINEYRGMLAERLLAKSDFDTDTEVRTLEHLKKRFGENNLHSCEVMMKDLADSKRLYNTIRAMPTSVRSPRRGRRPIPNTGIGPASATIISALYWPPLQSEVINLPQEVDSFLDEYADKFFVAKAPRKLVWMKHLGSVDLTLTVHGVSKDFSVSPFEASILMAFQDDLIQEKLQSSAAWADDKLAGYLGITVDVLRRKASFWVKHGVLAESQGRGRLTYTRTTMLSSGEDGEDPEGGPIAMEEDEGGSTLVSQEEQLKQEMSVYEQYIMGMLTNFEAGLALDRIHNMLKMFVPEQAYDKNIDQLAAFLGQLVADEKLFNTGNVYTKQS